MARELTPKAKGELQAKDLAHVRKAYATRLGQLKAEDATSYGGNGWQSVPYPMGQRSPPQRRRFRSGGPHAGPLVVGRRLVYPRRAVATWGKGSVFPNLRNTCSSLIRIGGLILAERVYHFLEWVGSVDFDSDYCEKNANG
jgi:hypothetical protein